MLKIYNTSRFKKDLKLLQKRGLDLKPLYTVISMLSEEKPLPEINDDHPLKGNYKGCRECHIGFDWIMVYKIHGDILLLELIRTGTHQDVFK